MAGREDSNLQAFLTVQLVILNPSAHSVFANHYQHDYLIRVLCEPHRKMGNLIEEALGCKMEMNDLRDWPPEGRANGVSLTPRPEGYALQEGQP